MGFELLFSLFGDFLIFAVIGGIIAALVGIFLLFRAIDSFVEDKVGKKRIKAVRIMGVSVLLIVALCFFCKYRIIPTVWDVRMGVTVKSYPPSLIEELSYVKVDPSAVTVSSEPPPSSDGTRHDAAMAIDDDVYTSWWEDDKGTGEGEWISLTYDSPISVAAITVWSGIWGERPVDQSDHPSYLTITIFNGNRIIGKRIVETDGCVTVLLNQPEEIDSIHILISGVKRGTIRRDGNAAISEILVYEKGSLSYVSSSKMITDEAMDKMKTQAETVFAEHFAEESEKELDSMTCVGYYFIKRIKKDAHKDNNYIYLIYKITDIYNGRPNTSYHYFYFKNLISSDDGTCHVDTTVYGDGYYRSYESVDDLAKDLGLPKRIRVNATYRMVYKVNE